MSPSGAAEWIRLGLWSATVSLSAALAEIAPIDQFPLEGKETWAYMVSMWPWVVLGAMSAMAKIGLETKEKIPERPWIFGTVLMSIPVSFGSAALVTERVEGLGLQVAVVMVCSFLSEEILEQLVKLGSHVGWIKVAVRRLRLGDLNDDPD